MIGSISDRTRPTRMIDLDLFEFTRTGAHAEGRLHLNQMPRMLAEVAADAPERDSVFEWRADGSMREFAVEVDSARSAALSSPSVGPCLSLALRGALWLQCQRCLEPLRQELDLVAEYRVMASEQEADAFPLDDDRYDVIVGSRSFDLLELIEEEGLLSLPLVAKHDVCPETPAHLLGQNGRPNPFAALAGLKHGEDEAEREDVDEAGDNSNRNAEGGNATDQR
jgi:uncharacterized protein